MQDRKNQRKRLVFIDLFCVFFMPFSYNGEYFQPGLILSHLPSKLPHFMDSNCKIIVPPKEMLHSFSIGTFMTYFDVTDRKPYYTLIYSIVQKNNLGANNSMKNTKRVTFLFRSDSFQTPPKCWLTNQSWLLLRIFVIF